MKVYMNFPGEHMGFNFVILDKQGVWEAELDFSNLRREYKKGRKLTKEEALELLSHNQLHFLREQ